MSEESKFNESKYLSVEPDLTIDNIDLDEILNEIPDYDETDKNDKPEPVTTPISYDVNVIENILSLKSENFILTLKTETLNNMVIEYSTKFKEVELQLQHQYNLKEQQYMNKIEQLQYQIKNQKNKLHALENIMNVDHNYKNKYQIQTDYESKTNTDYFKKHNKQLLFQNQQQKHQLRAIENENIELRAINHQNETKILQQFAYIELLKQKIEQKYVSLNSMKYIRTDSTQTVQLRDLQKSSTATRSHTLSKLHSSIDTAKIFEHEYANFNPSLISLRLPGSTENMFENFNDVTAEEKTIETKPQIIAIPLTNIHESKSMNILLEEHRTQKGKLVIKQIPHTETHICVNVSIALGKGKVEYVVVYFDKSYSVKRLIELLTSSESMYNVLKHQTIYVYAANDDGDVEPNAIALKHEQIIGKMGIINFYVKLSHLDNTYKSLNTIKSMSASVDEESTHMNQISNAPICNNNCVIV